ncbi:cytochrome c biogenesis protein CcdA [Guptibacillus hwajinpoensis]|uniref:cytochrome c biogenesis protein CcdA n=1 Tax=Guptibacillus hwajinpoensis TaxID=208199 RepID=UPI00384AAC72
MPLYIKQKKRGTNYLNSLLVAFIFAAGWTPCIGPIFGAIMYATVLNPAQTFILMAFFINKTRILLKYSDMLTKIGNSGCVYINVWFPQYRLYK